MTDKEIKKALECCSTYITLEECAWSDCPFVTEKGCSLELDELQKLSLDLINRQEAENEINTMDIDSLERERDALQEMIIEQKAQLEKKDIEIDILIRKKETLRDEIAEQKAKIERLKAECGNQSALWSKHYERIFETTKEYLKSEARKEFWERLKSKKCAKGSRVIYVDRIVETLKEMEGEK